MHTYCNLFTENGKICIIPNNDEGLEFLLDKFIKFINHWASELGDGDLLSMEGKVVSVYLVSWTLFKLYLEITRNTHDPFGILSEAKAIYFSSILINREINIYQDLFPIDRSKIFEAERLKTKYGTEFKIENFIQSIENERLSTQAREMAFRSYLGGQ